MDSCEIDYRRLGSSQSARMRIIYNDDTSLQVYVDLDPLNPAWTPCISVNNIILPVGRFFSLSAATGGISDQHEVYRFETFGIRSHPNLQPDPIGAPTVPRGPIFKDHKGLFDTVKGWFGGDSDSEQEKIQRNFRPGRNGRTMEDILNLVEEKEMEVTKNRLAHLSEEERAAEIKSLERFHQVQTAMKQDLKPKTTEDDNTPTQFLVQDHLTIERLSDLLLLQHRAIAEIMDKLANVGTRDDIQALHALMLQMTQTTAQNTESQINQLHSNIKEKMDALHSTVDEAARLRKAQNERTELILNQVQRNRRELSDSIKSESGNSFWFMFILFQIVFGAAFYIWKRYNDEMNKKLY